MGKSTKSIGIVAAGVIILGIVLLITGHKPAASGTIITPTPTITITPTEPASSSKYTPQFRALARARFIESCKAKEGAQYGAECNCGADYLAAHYTDTQLEKAYVEYHSTNKIPSEVRAAYDACKTQ